MNYKELAKVNGEIKTTPIRGKNYAEVRERINAFRKLYPEGFIETEIKELDAEHCVIQAKVGYYAQEQIVVDVAGSEYSKNKTELRPIVLASGTASEYKAASQINRTSYVENCETSAIGRALGMMGIGIDVAIASAEEVRYTQLIEEPTPVEVRKDDPELKAVKEEFAAMCKNHKMNGAIICKHFGIGSKPTAEQLMTALEAMAKAVKDENIPEAWRVK